MAETTKIEWVDHTFNPWIGCTRVSPACDHCYAAAMSHRRKWARFETGAPRKRTGAANWRQPLLWNRKAEAAGRRAKVFGPSLADPFDAEVTDAWRDDYVALIEQCPSLDFILLTKRPQVAKKYFANRTVPGNLWPGITAENQKMLELRAPAILSIDAKVHVLSAEPLLGPLDLTNLDEGGGKSYNALTGWLTFPRISPRYLPSMVQGHTGKFGWVIAGGESGPGARPSHPSWFRSLRDACQTVNVPFFFKQWGEWIGVSDLRRLPGGGGPGFGDYDHCKQDVAADSVRVGKKKAGALLDGREHREFPA